MQRKKNIRLIIVLVTLLVLTVITYVLVQPKDTIDVDRDLFSYQNTLEIDKVVFKSSNTVELNFERNQWSVNTLFEADPQRINVLFAILQQVRVRRSSASAKQVELKNKFSEGGIKVELYSQGTLLKSFEVLGLEENSLTYMRLTQDESYLVEIPGYKSYLAGIFTLDENGWKNPLVFQLNWANLASVSLSYPINNANNLDIRFEERNLTLNGVERVDSTKLGNLIDDISLFYVNDYLDASEVEANKVSELKALIEVKDIAKNNHTVGVFGEASSSEYYIQIDSSQYALIDKQLVNRVTKPKAYFLAPK